MPEPTDAEIDRMLAEAEKADLLAIHHLPVPIYMLSPIFGTIGSVRTLAAEVRRLRAELERAHIDFERGCRPCDD